MKTLRYPLLAMVCALSFLLLVGCEGKEARIQSHIVRAEKHHEGGNLEKARVEYRNVLQIDPNNLEALKGNAEVSKQLKLWKDAAALYTKIIELDQDNIEAKEQLARLFFLGRAPDKSIDLVDEILAKDAENGIALSIKAAVAATQGNDEEALAYINRSLASMPGYLDAVMIKASLLEKRGDAVSAINVLRAGLDKNKDSAGILTVMAQIHDKQGNKEEAAKLLRQVMTLYPDETSYRGQVIKYLVKVGKIEEAESVLQDGIKLDEDNIDLKLNHIKFAERTHGTKRAIALAESYQNSDKEHSSAFKLELSKLLAKNDEQDLAFKYLNQLVNDEGIEKVGLEARVVLASLYAQDSDYTRALEVVDEVLIENPQDSKGLMLRAKIRFLQDDNIGSINDARSVLRDQPDYFDALLLLGQAHLKNNDTHLARQAFDKAIASSNNPVQFALKLAQIYDHHGAHREAVEEYERVIANQGVSDEIAILAVKSQIAGKDYEGAVQMITQLSQLQSHRAGLPEYLSGLVYLAKDDSGQAIEAFKAALLESPGAAEAMSALVKTRLGSSQVDEAIIDVKKIVDILPAHFAALNILGELHLMKGEPNKSIELFNKAIAAKKDFITPYNNLAAAYLVLEQNEMAIQALKRGIAANNNAVQLVTSLALQYEKQGKIDRAIRVYSDAYKENPESAALANNLAMLLVTYKQDSGSLAEASQYTDQLKATNNPAYLDTIGWVRYAQGDYAGAEKYLIKAVESAPDQPLLNYHLGMVMYKKGDMILAKKYLGQSLKGDRKFKDRDEAMSLLQALSGEG
jgi:tetratricopeptide (TPR) repeat protein